jgi:uncharacterized protein YjbI with pentapeptide repeats
MMAEETHLAVLRQGVDRWNRWRAADPSTKPDLSNANLRGLALAKADLSEADLGETDLRGTILSDAVLIGANLAGANLFKAVIDGADLSGANLTGARFLNAAQLMTARNWQSAFRDSDLVCGAAVPPIPGRS